MPKKKTQQLTLDDLAVMVQKGFAETATKAELEQLRTEMNSGFDRINNVLMSVHEGRLDRLEDKVQRLETKLARR